MYGTHSPVAQLPARLNEASKIGFKRALIPKVRRKIEGVPPDLKLLSVRNIAEALNIVMPKDQVPGIGVK